MTKPLTTLCVATALTAFVGTIGVLAQGQMAGQMPGMGPPGMGMMGRGMPGMMRMMAECPMMMGADMPTHADGRIAFLKAELGITDSQKGTWDGYAAALTRNFQDMQAMRQAMMKTMEAKTPVERLDNHIAAMEGRLAALKDLKPTLGTLYSALSEEQKKKADDVLTGMGCMM